MRKLITISVSSALLKRATQVAQEESKTGSELVREALQLYVDTRGIRGVTSRERLGVLVGKIQGRTKGTPLREVRRMVREAVRAARRTRRRATA